MEPFKKQYIVDEQNRRVAVQIDIETFEKIEDLLEDYALYELMQQASDDKALNLNEARAFYDALPKAE